ncbi:hypothetical protein [Paenibacillus sp. XY044]|uniref:hypothetical protein n=1 Tax=Paenibacillus sp. XY044 TaxID=2026089 RepID=UPI000B99205B|nr:hypothetical protein [Paenibacillus sp. XY044]OZB95944.1 hypothetical protein CJP46_08365 [Paenibacillus sp. XY044]
MPSITDALRARGIGSGGAGIKQEDLTALIDITNTAEANNDAIKLDVVNKLNAMNPALNLTTASSWSTIRAAIGSMQYRGAQTVTPGPSDIPIPAGYHNGAGKVSAVTVPVASVLAGTTIAGQTGTMPNRGAVTITPTAVDQVIAAGYHNGAGVVKGVSVPAAYLVEGYSVAGQAGKVSNYSREQLTNLGGEEKYINPSSYKGDGLGNIMIAPQTGYYTGTQTSKGFGSITVSDNNLIPANILAGRSIFGVIGTASTWKIANGYQNPSPSAASQYYPDRDGQNILLFPFEVKQNFGFTPRIVIAWRNDREGQESIFVDASVRGLSTSYMKSGLSAIDWETSKSRNLVYANSGGFSIPTYYGTSTYYHWVVIG